MQLSQQSTKSKNSLNVVLHINHININWHLHLIVFKNHNTFGSVFLYALPSLPIVAYFCKVVSAMILVISSQFSLPTGDGRLLKVLDSSICTLSGRI